MLLRSCKVIPGEARLIHHKLLRSNVKVIGRRSNGRKREDNTVETKRRNQEKF